MWDRWVIDASITGCPFCFCPIEGDLNGEYSIITGFSFLGPVPPNGTVVAVVHEEGQEAADLFYADHKEEIDAMLAKPPADTEAATQK